MLMNGCRSILRGHLWACRIQLEQSCTKQQPAAAGCEHLTEKYIVTQASSTRTYAVRTFGISAPSLLERRHGNSHNKNMGKSKTLLDRFNEIIRGGLKHFPFLRKYYQQMLQGFKQHRSDYKTWRTVREKTSLDAQYQTIYREEKAIFHLKESLLKSSVLLPLFLLPMGAFIVFIPVVFFPQYLLPRCYWNSGQRMRFLTLMHSAKVKEHKTVIHHLRYLRNNHGSSAFKRSLEPILDIIDEKKVPNNDDLLDLKNWSLNNSNPLNLTDSPPLLVQSFASINSLWRFQPTSWLTYELQRRVSLILRLDRKLLKENLCCELNDIELQEATFLRGIDSAQLSRGANQYWLSNWVELTKLCDDMDWSFVLHAMVLQSINYSELKYQRRVFD